MSVSAFNRHLPACPVARNAYRRLYGLIHGVDKVFHGDARTWRTRSIPPALDARAVYELLPTAPDREFGGHLTRTRIHYAPGGATGAYVVAAQPCTFHSHPAADPGADLPSAIDIYSFLRYRNLRAITVGATRIWVFDKTIATLATVERLNAWEVRHQVDVIRQVGFDGYRRCALEALGLRWAATAAAFRRNWPQRLHEELAIGVTVYDRHAPARGPLERYG